MKVDYVRQGTYRIGLTTGIKDQEALVQQRSWMSYLFGWIHRDIGVKDIDHCDNRRRKGMSDAMYHWVELKRALIAVKEAENDHKAAVEYAKGGASRWERTKWRKPQPIMPDCSDDFEKFAVRILKEMPTIFKNLVTPPPPRGVGQLRTPEWARRTVFWMLDDPTKPLPSGRLMGDEVDHNIAWKLQKDNQQQSRGSKRGGRKGQQDNDQQS